MRNFPVLLIDASPNDDRDGFSKKSLLMQAACLLRLSRVFTTGRFFVKVIYIDPGCWAHDMTLFYHGGTDKVLLVTPFIVE